MASIKEVSYSEQHKVKIVTSSPDLNVYVTSSKSEAKDKDEIWIFDNSSSSVKI